MMTWLRNLIRRWLSEDDPSNTLEVILDGKIQRVVAMTVVGLRLHCVVPMARGAQTVLIPVEQAVNRTEFQRLWTRMGGRAHWADGKKFKPGI